MQTHSPQQSKQQAPVAAQPKAVSGDALLQRVPALEEEELLQGKFETGIGDPGARPEVPPIQRQPNKTGLPDNLKSGIENLSGYSMDDVKVHYNSDQPAQLNAHAYAQGSDIHIAPGQERHLPHEAWHVVQQKQGRVRPTIQLKDKVSINDDVGLEQEASLMGDRAQTYARTASLPMLPYQRSEALIQPKQETTIYQASSPVQCKIDATFAEGGQVANRQNIEQFFTDQVKDELKRAEKEVDKNDLLQRFKGSLIEYKRSYTKRRSSAIEHDYPNNWRLTAEALDDLVNHLNKISSENSRPGVWGPEGDWVPIPGSMAEEGVLDNWGYAEDEVLNPDDYISFYHSTTAKDKIENSQIKIIPGAKEFGQGFYTTTTDIDEPAKKIGDEWFTKKQKKKEWIIIRFDVPKAYAQFLYSEEEELNIFLTYVLTHSSGFPSGANPDEEDMRKINAINMEGKVLIFPGDKSTEVETVIGKKSWDDYTKNKLGGGNYELVVGPQQPEYMGSWRQYAFTGVRGLWLMNTARRFIAYDNDE